MDWNKLYSEGYANDLDLLDFNAKAVNSYHLEKQRVNDDPSFETQQLGQSSDLEQWLTERSLSPSQPIPRPHWSLRILALRRGPRNASEQSGDGSDDQLATLGCSREHFEKINDSYNLSKAFPAYILSDQACFARQLEYNYNTPSKIEKITFTLRSSQSVSRDLALSSTYSATRKEVFALIIGCNETDVRRIDEMLANMKTYAGHPLLIVALFLELQHKSLTARYREL